MLPADAGNHLPTPEGGKEGHTKIHILAELGSNQGLSGQKAEILPTEPTMPAQNSFQFIVQIINS